MVVLTVYFFFLEFLKKQGCQAVEIESFDSGGFEARETSMISGKKDDNCRLLCISVLLNLQSEVWSGGCVFEYYSCYSVITGTW